MIIVLTGVFLMFFAVINMQLFGYLDPPKECLDIGKGQFGNFFLVCISLFLQNFVFCIYMCTC